MVQSKQINLSAKLRIHPKKEQYLSALNNHEEKEIVLSLFAIHKSVGELEN